MGSAMPTHKLVPHPKEWHEGMKVQVFSYSARKWVTADVVRVYPEDEQTRVEYVVEDQVCGKTLHMWSPLLGFNSLIAEDDDMIVKMYIEEDFNDQILESLSSSDGACNHPQLGFMRQYEVQ